MKYIIPVLLLASLNATAQTDSSQLQLPIKLTLKVKYWGQLGYYLSAKSPTSDTALKCIGSGLQLDSLSTGTIRAGRFLQFLKTINQESPWSNTAMIYDFMNATVSNGGLMAQLKVYTTNGSANEKKIATWLRSQILLFQDLSTDVFDEKTQFGISNLRSLQTKIID